MISVAVKSVMSGALPRTQASFHTSSLLLLWTFDSIPGRAVKGSIHVCFPLPCPPLVPRDSEQKEEPSGAPTDEGSATLRLWEDPDSVSDEIVKQTCKQTDVWAAVEAAARDRQAHIRPPRVLTGTY